MLGLFCSPQCYGLFSGEPLLARKVMILVEAQVLLLESNLDFLCDGRNTEI